MTRQNRTLQIYFGAEGIRHIYNESLKQKTLDIICLANNYEQVIGDYFDKIFSPKVSGKITTREILPDTSENRKYLTQKNQSINAVRFLKNESASESDILIWKDTIVLISFNKNSPMAIMISEPELLKSFTLQFETLWRSLS